VILRNRIKIISNQFLSVIATLSVGKLIARFIDPSVFGNYSIQLAIFTFFFSVFISPVLQFIKTNNNSLNKKIGVIHYTPILFSLIFFSLILFLIINNIFSSKIKLLDVIYVFFFLLFSILVKYFVDLESTSGKVVRASFLNCLNKILILLAFIFVLSFFDVISSTEIWLFNSLGSFILLLIIFNSYNYKLYGNFKISIKNILFKIKDYSFPLVIMSIWSWVNSYFDRFILDSVFDKYQVGLYAASYSVGSKLFPMIIPFFLLLLTPIVYSNKKVSLKIESIKKYSINYLIIGITITPLVFIFSDLIGFLLLSSNYKESFYIIPYVSLAYYFLTFSYIFESLFYAESRTKNILLTNFVSAVFNIILNLILVPHFGLIGAAISTVISSFLKLVHTYLLFRKI